MKQRMEPVHVDTNAQGEPWRLVWHGRSYRVMQIEDRWRYAGKWWLDGRGWHRGYFRVTVRGARSLMGGESLTVEVFRQGANWVLAHEGD